MKTKGYAVHLALPTDEINEIVRQIVKDELSKQNYSEHLLTVDQAAELCGVTRNTFYIWLRKGLIDKVDFGDRCIRVKQSDVTNYIESRIRRREDDIESIIQSGKY